MFFDKCVYDLPKHERNFLPSSMEKMTASKTLAGTFLGLQPKISQISGELKFSPGLASNLILSN